jgi:ribosomal protein L24
LGSSPPLFTQYQICISSYNRKVGREKVALTCEKTNQTKKSPQKIAIDQNVQIWMIKKFNTFIDRA